jgi:thioredoxin reductase (NADPH)
METFDVIIIGAGPAGISAGIYLKRSNVNNIVVFDNASSSLDGNYKIENLYAFESISSKELKERGIEQAKALGIGVKNENVVHVDYNYETSEIMVTTTDNIYKAKSLIFATGKKRISLKIEGLKELEGKGVSYCATCDGFFYRKKDVVVIGSKDFAINEYNVLKNIARSVTLCTNGEVFNGGFDYENRKIIKIGRENDKVTLTFEDGTILYVDGVFIALGNASSSDFAKQLGIEMNANNDIIVDKNCKTNYENIYAAGDCTGGILQISKAEYEGMIAGMEVGKYIRRTK